MSGSIKKAVLAVCTASAHFCVTVGLFFGAMWANAQPAPRLEQTFSSAFLILSFPGSFFYDLIDADGYSFAAYFVVTAISSLIWGVVLMPLVLFLKRRLRRKRTIDPSS